VWKRSEPALDRETVDGIIRKLMDIDFKLQLLVVHFGLTDEDEEEDDDS
jgi:hypothetical protein